MKDKITIDAEDNHISFQKEDITIIVKALEELEGRR
jgi:hypothetical protein